MTERPKITITVEPPQAPEWDLLTCALCRREVEEWRMLGSSGVMICDDCAFTNGPPGPFYPAFRGIHDRSRFDFWWITHGSASEVAAAGIALYHLEKELEKHRQPRA